MFDGYLEGKTPPPRRRPFISWKVGLFIGVVIAAGNLARSHDAREGRVSSKWLAKPIGGFSFAMTRPEVEARCREAGFEALDRPKRQDPLPPIPRVLCVGVPEAVPFPGNFVQVEAFFCADRVCLLKLTSYDRADYDPLIAAMGARYGLSLTEDPFLCTEEMQRSSGCSADVQNGPVSVWLEPPAAASSFTVFWGSSAKGDYVFFIARNAEAMRLGY